MTAQANNGRTRWRPKPCGWRDRERVVALGEEFGPAGPLVLDVLEELCKEQRGEENAGAVRAGLRSLARSAFLPRGGEGVELARTILAFAESVGAIDELAIDDDATMTVTCRVSGFAADHGRGYDAVSKSNQRAAKKPDNDVVSSPADDARTTSASNETASASEGTLSDSSGQRPEDADDVPLQDRTVQDNNNAAASGGEGGKVIRATFGGKPVPDARLDLAQRLLEFFNQAARTRLAPFTGQKRPSDALQRILGALTDWPDVTEDEWAAVIRYGLANPFWDGPAQPGNVIGKRVVQRNLDHVRRRAAPAVSNGGGLAHLNQRAPDDDL